MDFLLLSLLAPSADHLMKLLFYFAKFSLDPAYHGFNIVFALAQQRLALFIKDQHHLPQERVCFDGNMVIIILVTVNVNLLMGGLSLPNLILSNYGIPGWRG